MKNSSLAMDGVRVSVRDGDVAYDCDAGVARAGVGVLRGRDAIAAKVGMLQELSERTGQAGAMRWLESAMGRPTEAKKIPTLLLIGLNPNVAAAEASAEDVVGAVMLYEYKLAGCGLRVFATDDMNGLETVIAPGAIRLEVAEAACGDLMEGGAIAALITLSPESGYSAGEYVRMCERQTPLTGFASARRVRSLPLGLQLGATFEETLTSLGKHTRRNLRYYRRRLESEKGSEYVPQVAMSRGDFLAFNVASMNPASEAWARWRYDSAHSESGMMFAGMRAQDGQWLSLIGGRRHGETVYIDWQMNLAGLARYSLSTVMRSYVLEHETGLGTRAMVFTGGTPHSMRHSFTHVDAMDVIGLRRSFAGRMLQWMAKWALRRNFLGQTLSDPQLRWK